MIEFPKAAMVLAAGLGERMRPLTDHTPKPLLELGGKPFLVHILQALEKSGVETAIVNVHHLAEQIEEHIQIYPAQVATPLANKFEGRGVSELHVLISDERDAKLETGGGVKRALPLLGPIPFFTLNADMMWTDTKENTLQRMAEIFDETKMDALLLLQPLERVTGAKNNGDCFLDEEGRVSFRGTATAAPYMFAGITLTHPRLYNDAPKGAFSQKLLWDRAQQQGRLFGIVHDGDWFHASTPDDLATINAAWRS